MSNDPKEISRRAAWILWIGSSLLTTLLFFLFHPLCERAEAPPPIPEKEKFSYLAEASLGKERLPPGYLQELLQLTASTDISSLSMKKLEELLLSSPLIRSGHVRQLSPFVLYVSYTMRSPVACIADIDNGAIDLEGVCFPLRPFFTPKNLPSLYLGLTKEEISRWGERVQGEKVELSFFLFSLFSKLEDEEEFAIRHIDVSHAFASSLGRREVVVETGEGFLHSGEERKKRNSPHYLRLRASDYEEQLTDYIQLRQHLISRDKGFSKTEKRKQVIDLRLPHVAYLSTE